MLSSGVGVPADDRVLRVHDSRLEPTRMKALPRPALLALSLLAGCFDPRPKPIIESPAAASKPALVEDPNDMGPFKLKPEWRGPCERADKVDVNLGNAPAAFVRAAHCQVVGSEPS